MALKEYSVLIIDDHPIIISAYKTALNHFSRKHNGIEFSIESALNCDAAFKFVNSCSELNTDLDLVFLDIRLPPSENGLILSGEDLGIKIKDKLPKTKIIVSTTLNDNYRVHSLLKSLNPDGFLIKNDITPGKLINAIDSVLKGTPYYSETVLKLLRKQVSNNLLIDTIDRKILFELSIGTKMRELPKLLPLSIAGVEKRKRRLKQVFEMKTSSDKELLDIAREKGFI